MEKTEGKPDVEGTSDTGILKTKSVVDVCDKFNLVHVEPTNYIEVASSQTWIDVMKVEINAFERNGTWKLVNLP